MDFQLARNLSALARAQQQIAQALLHIDSLSDCINREIIMSAASSATEQLVASAKATLLQVQNILATQSDEGACRFRDAQLSFITERRERSSSTSASHNSQTDSFVGAYGVMISRDDGESARFNSTLLFTRLEICGGPSCGYPFLVGLTDAG